MQWRRFVAVILTSAAVIFVVIGHAERLGISRDRRPDPTEEVRRGRELDKKFVDALISRYQDTMAIAEEESRNGHNKHLKRLAASLIEMRKRELAQLTTIRDGGYEDDTPAR
jgi:uncharacterized protein (DUF305 family)